MSPREDWEPWLDILPSDGAYSLEEATQLRCLHAEIRSAEQRLAELKTRAQAEVDAMQETIAAGHARGFDQGLKRWLDELAALERGACAAKRAHLDALRAGAKMLCETWFSTQIESPDTGLEETLLNTLTHPHGRDDVLILRAVPRLAELAARLELVARARGWQVHRQAPNTQTTGLEIDHAFGRMIFAPERLVDEALDNAIARAGRHTHARRTVDGVAGGRAHG